MFQVLDYKIPMTEYFSLDLPKEAKILTIQEQNNNPQIWALVNPDNLTETRNFYLNRARCPIEEDINTLDYSGGYPKFLEAMK